MKQETEKQLAHISADSPEKQKLEASLKNLKNLSDLLKMKASQSAGAKVIQVTVSVGKETTIPTSRLGIKGIAQTEITPSSRKGEYTVIPAQEVQVLLTNLAVCEELEKQNGKTSIAVENVIQALFTK